MGGDLVLRAVDGVIGNVRAVQSAFASANDVMDPLILGATRGGLKRARALDDVAAQALAAERSLEPIAAREPGLQPFLDAIRSARALQSMRLPERHRVGRVIVDLTRELQAVDAWRHVRPMSQEDRAAAVVRLRSLETGQLAPDDWKTLAGIVGDDPDRAMTAGLPRMLGDALSIRDLSLNIANRGGAHTTVDSKWAVTRRYFAAWKASQGDVDVRRARIDELLTGTPEARTSAEWEELAALLDAGGHDVVSHPWFPGETAEFGVRSAALRGFGGPKVIAPPIERATPDELAAARAQLLGTGDLDDLATSILRRDELMKIGITGMEARSSRLRHLLPTYPADARRWLGDMGPALTEARVEGPVLSLRDSALDLVRRNIARIEGEKTWYGRSLSDGWSNHPDYAELGRIRETWQLVEQLAQPSRARSAPATAPVQGAADELLPW